MLASVGTKVYGNWGAMHPHSYGTVISAEDSLGEQRVQWEDGSTGHFEIHEDGYRSVNGSSIGVFVDTHYLYRREKMTKDEMRGENARLTEEFLANGGKVRKVAEAKRDETLEFGKDTLADEPQP
jgi:hypothetical protein